MRKFLLTTIILVAIAALVIGGLRYIRLHRTPTEEIIRTAVVQRGSIEAVVSASGSIAPERQVSLTFGAAGKVAKVRADEGDYVWEGQELARLDTDDIELQIAQAEYTLIMQQATLSQTIAGPSEADIAAARASLHSAQKALEKLKAGPDEKAVEIARLNWEIAKNALWQAQLERDAVRGNPAIPGHQKTIAEAQVGAAEFRMWIAELQYKQAQEGPSPAEIAAAEAQVAQARATLDKLLRSPTDEEVAIAQARVDQARVSLEQARQLLEKSIITAPFAGTVVAVNIQEGEMAAAGVPAIVLADLSRFHIDVDVDEVDIGQVQIGQPVSITVDALPGVELSGQVESIALVPTVQGGVVSYKVTIAIDPADAPLRTGMTANARILTKRLDNVLLVPNWAIRFDREAGKAYVEKQVGPDAYEQVEIKTGMRNERYSVVLSGLEEGDTVVVRTVSGREQLRGIFGPPRRGGR